MAFSEIELGLEPRWFTGKEWSDGTAEKILIAEYFQAIAELAARRNLPSQTRDRGLFDE